MTRLLQTTSLRPGITLLIGAIALCLHPSEAWSQHAPPTVAEHAGEPFIFELSKRSYRFKSDGTGRHINETRIRVQNETGVQQLGQLLFSYLAGRDRLQLDYLRVRRPDGSVAESSPDLIQDLPAPVSAQFPIYSDLRILHVTVPSFRPGDVIEYRLTTYLEDPDAPNRFWVAEVYERNAVVLDERIEIDVPTSEPILLHTAEGMEAEIREAGGRRIYRWTRTNATPKWEPPEETDGAESFFDIELSNFRNWAEVGAWYEGLQGERAMPTKAVRLKAQELLDGLEDDRSKIEALYHYVATELRYLALQFGIARYQPNRASEILSNGYGDCKDKHTLLAALLVAAGFQPSPVLIGSFAEPNEAVPSLTGFDHVITAVPLGEELLLLDSTQPLPFGYLDFSLRGQQALLIPDGGDAHLISVPDHLPFSSLQNFSLTGEVDPTGNLNARVEHSFRGDAEAILRTTFLGIPKSEWQDVVLGFNAGLGLKGEISNLDVTEPTAIREPFRLRYTLARSDWLNLYRQSQNVELPRPQLEVLEAPPNSAESTDPIELGELSAITSNIELKLPAGFTARAPVPVAIDRGFASFKSHYSATDQQLIAERQMIVKQRQIEPEQGRAWAALFTTVGADAKQTFAVQRSPGSALEVTESTDAEALYEAGLSASKSKDYDTAMDLFSRVVELEPKHDTAWYYLGRTRVKAGQVEESIEAFRRQIEMDPFHERVHSNLGWAFEKLDDVAGAKAAYLAQLEHYPLTHYANARLGELLDEEESCEEAVPYLESALSIESDDHDSRMRLGRCYLRLKRQQEGISTLEHLMASNKSDLLHKAGYAAIEHQAYGTAVRLLRRVTELDSDHSYAFNNLGRALLELGQLEEAESAIRQQIEIEPGDPWAHYNLYRALMMQGSPSQAVEAVRRHLEIVPDDTAALQGLAMALWSEQKRDEAAETLRRLVKIDPDYPAVYSMLGVVLFELDRIDEAASELEKALAIDASNFGANHALGLIRARQERNAEALRLLEKAKAISPEQFQLQDMLDYVRQKVAGADQG